MVKFLVVTTFCFLTLATISLLMRVRKNVLSFSGGIIVGLFYFIVLPMSVILYTGSLANSGINAPAYNPYNDLETTLSIFVGWITCLLAFLYCRSAPVIRHISVHSAQDWRRYIWVYFTLYLLLAMYALIVSGFGSDGNHWHNSMTSTFSSSPSFLIAKNFANALRVMLYGVLLAWRRSNNASTKTVLALATVSVAFDVLTTFNRISLVFYAVFVLLLYGRRVFFPLAAMVSIAPLASTISSAWPYFRSTVFAQGFSLDAVASTWQAAISYAQTEATSIDRKLNALFEASNLVVLNFIVQNVGKTFDPFWGYTAILRPLTTFLPSSFWSDKPQVFGIYMGLEINSYVGLALNSTLFGEAIGNFPYVWPAYILLFIIFFERLFCWSERFVPGATAMSFFVGIALWRFDANFASVAVYALILLFALFFTHKNIAKLQRQ